MPSALLLLLAMQGTQQWIPPQPPCDIKAGHFRVNSAIVDLQSAASKPLTRDRMLSETRDILNRAITIDKQDKNPAVWYYFGRYYVEVGDAAGADTAFQKAVALAPQCNEDVDRYRTRLWADVLNGGLRNWQENRPDSAKLLLRQAASLRPSNPRAYAALGQLYESENKIDSASAYLNRAAAAAGNDTAFAQLKKEALGESARIYARRLQADPSVQKWQHTRFSRDSIHRLLAADSSVLARVEASSASRRARGARLAPADQQGFARDSAARAKAVADRRAALGGSAATVAADSSAAAPVFDPVIQAYRAYLQAYPEGTDVVPGLANLYYQSGRLADANAAFDAIYPTDRRFTPDVLIEAGQGALRANAFAVSARLLERGLQQAPYNRDGLVDLANAYQALRDSANLLSVAQRLAAIDPLNRTTLRLVAAGWDLRGRRDSAQKYRDLAEGGLQVDVAISTFQQDSTGYTLTGVATNSGNAGSTVQRLTFEFLDAMGHVQVTQAMEIPPLPPQGSHAIELRVPGTALVAWRYKSS
jgi:tetratricopeptide (TPR) repeat protein